jgi:PAS domain S-box-containing protein
MAAQNTDGVLRAKLGGLKKKLKKYESLEEDYRRMVEALKAKEAFNYALFEYSPATTVVVDRQGKIARTNAAKRRTGDRLPAIGDIMYRDYASKHDRDMHAELMDCMQSNTTKSFPEMRYGQKVLSITMSPFPEGAIITSQDITERVAAQRDREALIKELRKALDEVETLRGLLPICASCKKIRDDGGYWNTIEEYFSRRGNVDFSHTVCPECMQALYPEIWEKMSQRAHMRQAKQRAS